MSLDDKAQELDFLTPASDDVSKVPTVASKNTELDKFLKKDNQKKIKFWHPFKKGSIERKILRGSMRFTIRSCELGSDIAHGSAKIIVGPKDKWREKLFKELFNGIKTGTSLVYNGAKAGFKEVKKHATTAYGKPGDFRYHFTSKAGYLGHHLKDILLGEIGRRETLKEATKNFEKQNISKEEMYDPDIEGFKKHFKKGHIAVLNKGFNIASVGILASGPLGFGAGAIMLKKASLALFSAKYTVQNAVPFVLKLKSIKTDIFGSREDSVAERALSTKKAHMAKLHAEGYTVPEAYHPCQKTFVDHAQSGLDDLKEKLDFVPRKERSLSFSVSIPTGIDLSDEKKIKFTKLKTPSIDFKW